MLTPSLLSDAPGARIFLTPAAPPEWMWTLAYGQNEDRTPTHGYAATREAMAAFAKVDGGSAKNLSGARRT